ncbi:hypothetical protein BOW43_12460 [Solemya velum gill symbiont]|nr:hypothetical protein BOW43_12460 [Solemya velum gill symbiont]
MGEDQMEMQNMLGSVSENLHIIIPILLVLIGLIIVYLVFMVRAIIDMLRYDVNSVLITFSFLALIPFPLFIILGVMILIIWHHHKKDILAGKIISK